MPEIPARNQQPQPAPPTIELPREFPRVPDEIVERFPQAGDWQRRLDDFWRTTNQALQQAQTQTAKQVNSTVVYSVDRFLIYANGVPTPMFDLDSTGVRLGGVLVVNTPSRKVYIGTGQWGDPNTPFYVDADGFFSLGDSLMWDPDTDTLTIVGVINATSGTIGGFEIGPNYIRDSANSFGLSSVVTVGDDVRFWAGDTFANRNSAPLRLYESGAANFGLLSISAAGVVSLGSTVTIVGDGDNVGLTFGGFLNASASPAIAMQVGAFLSLTATGNGQTLEGLSINPGYVKGAFTSLNAYGIFIALNVSSGAGTISNAYGLYINTVNIGTANWGLYVATTARNFMAGDLTVASIGATTPGSGAFTTLSATGTVTLGALLIMTSASDDQPLFTMANSGSGGRTWQLVSCSNAGVVPSGLAVYDGTAGAVIAGFTITGLAITGALKVSGLAGVGIRNVVADAAGNLSAP